MISKIDTFDKYLFFCKKQYIIPKVCPSNNNE
jgi:hypothetical protein